jgi:2-polyprenyl-3-methyl-5-hydroxy-6-metoxy-1,4-benzoquinol methylase
MPPSPLVIQWAARIAQLAPPGPRALDVAVGRGRHYETLARAGFRVFGVDVAFEAVRDAVAQRAEGVAPMQGWCADLTTAGLPVGRFDLVLVTRYLERALFPAIRDAVVPGGVVVYETFTVRQLRHGRGPVSLKHLLEPGELLTYFSGFEILFYEECAEPDALASLVARRRS